MNNFLIEINDKQTFFKDHIIFSEKDLIESMQKAGKNPVTPLIVKKIEKKAKEKGCNINISEAEFFRIAKEILIEKQGTASIPVRKIEKEKQTTSLHIIQYSNSVEDIESLSASIRDKGNIPIVWCKARGFIINNPSSENIINQDTLKDPIELIKFIIAKPQERLSYILEDFHHYIGEKDSINPNVGEIRSLIKDLHRNLKGRNESVYFFVPSSYELPFELMPLFINSSQKSKNIKHKLLDRFGKHLTDPEYISRKKPIIGVGHIIDRVIQILAQMESNNPLLVGHPGVGKTAIVEGLAKSIVDGKVSHNLKNKKLYLLSLNSLVAGTKYRGDFEIRLEGLMEEVTAQKDNIIIFIDEIHTLLDAGATETSIGAGDILKPLLARGEFPCIGATTQDGVEYFSKDKALLRRFKRVIVNPATPNEAIEILRGIANCFEKHHKLKIEDSALTSAVYLSEKHILQEYLPGKAIALIDGASAFCSMRGKSVVKKEDILAEMEKVTTTS
ncbi:MAG: ATP-dependent Clp protease ATP-binding subunit [Desulfobacterales bacterium]|nr:ATP-dependent Clp protease ATP-binding subunit [Desulfobacterales bacterium]